MRLLRLLGWWLSMPTVAGFLIGGRWQGQAFRTATQRWLEKKP